MRLILASEKDPAALNIAEKLIKEFGFRESSEKVYLRDDLRLELVPQEITELRELPVAADEVIVASRHASISGKPSLTAHVPGFPEEKKLAVASPITLRAGLLELRRAAQELGLPHLISLEATHHGPADFDVPITFFEIGSTEEEWKNDLAGMAVARAIMAAVGGGHGVRSAVGVGGLHYSPLFTRAVFSSDVAVGHIFPKHAEVDEDLLRKAVARTSGRVDLFLIDWKGATPFQREICRKVSEALGIPMVRAGSILQHRPP